MNKWIGFIVILNLIWNVILTTNVSRTNRWADSNYVSNGQINNRIDSIERDIKQIEKDFPLNFEREMNKRWNDFFPTLNPYPSNIQQILKR